MKSRNVHSTKRNAFKELKKILTKKIFCTIYLFSSFLIGQDVLSVAKVNTPEQVSTTSKEKIHIDFVGTGNLQGSLSKGEAIDGSAGIGVIYERFRGNTKQYKGRFWNMRERFIDTADIDNDNDTTELKTRRWKEWRASHERSIIGVKSYEIEATINVAATTDTISAEFNENMLIRNQRDFGFFILNPFTNDQSLFINTNVYLNPDGDHWMNNVAKIISGFNGRVIASNSVWNVGENQNINLGVLALRCGIFHEFLPDNKIRDEDGKTKYSVFLGLNMGYRGIFGDIISENNRDLRIATLGTDRTDFSGLEFNFGFRLENIRAEFQMPFLFGSDRNSILGLTNTQFLFTIRFVGGFGLKLNTKNPKKEEE
ncbi:hypothetical protein [Winogradskyella flava]|uniref:Uncharacterized protein n=1 Tax=Winogradskyella flava TaxID=1884876 RepID=A0A842ISY0_9FLAO|nr:hypothetical protein [Winogradskyella flava]MBC2844906.1 hypothetical protein [Winogradskyella flava]